MKFECKQCGMCCKSVGKIVNTMPIQFASFFSPDEKGWCSHLKEASGKFVCDIYEKRPILCRVEEMAKMRSKNLGVSEDDLIALASNMCELLRSMTNDTVSKI